MKNKVYFILVIICVSVFSSAISATDNKWYVQQAGEQMTQASPGYFKIADRKTGIMVGSKKDSQGNDAPNCEFMQDGEHWMPCPAAFFSTNMFDMTMVFDFESAQTMFGLKMKIVGLDMEHWLVKVDRFMTATDIYKFDKTDKPGSAMTVHEGIIWIGTTNGKLLKSEDQGASFTSVDLAGDEKVQIQFITFFDKETGIAGGGATEETPEGEEILLSKGGFWITEDGGTTWDELVAGKEYVAYRIAKNLSDEWYVLLGDSESFKSSPPAYSFARFTADFSSFEKLEPEAGARKLGSFTGPAQAGENEIWIAGICSDWQPCIFATFDGGLTWVDVPIPAEGMGGMAGFPNPIKAINFLDKNHGYAGNGFNAIIKYGDETEDYDEEPDEDLTPDKDTAKEADIIDKDSMSDEDSTPAPVDETGCGCTLIME